MCLEPSFDARGNSQHPNYNVAAGEQLIHDVYYALRSGPSWNQTLLIITYDEHGGYYDHVPPSSGAVPPDNSAGEYGFDFTRFGVRVPTVLVSPLIPAGTVLRVSAAATPFDHTSILKTVENRWNPPALTVRDAAAVDVSAALTLTTPRTHDPLAGVAVPVASGSVPNADQPSHLQEVQAELVAQLPVPDVQGPARPALAALRTNEDYKNFIRSHMQALQDSRKRLPLSKGI